MHKALIFTDIHMTEPGHTIVGLDPLARFSEGLAHALSRHPDAQHVILTGDLTHHGRPGEYDRLAGALEGCPIPVTLTLGNHDDRDAFARVFPGALNAQGFTQTALNLGPARLLVLDTHDHEGRAPRHGGWLCDDRLAWLDAELARDPDRPVAVLAHHPPFLTGFDAMDAINLANGPELLSRLKAASQVRQMICGHVHRTMSVSVGGLACAVLKSPCHQSPMILGPGNSSDSTDEPGAYGILLATGDTLILHSDDFALSTGVPVGYDNVERPRP